MLFSKQEKGKVPGGIKGTVEQGNDNNNYLQSLGYVIKIIALIVSSSFIS